jgi:hypothetical protein
VIQAFFAGLNGMLVVAGSFPDNLKGAHLPTHLPLPPHMSVVVPLFSVSNVYV